MVLSYEILHRFPLFAHLSNLIWSKGWFCLFRLCSRDLSNLLLLGHDHPQEGWWWGKESKTLFHSDPAALGIPYYLYCKTRHCSFFKLKFIRNVCSSFGILAEQVTVQGFTVVYYHCQYTVCFVPSIWQRLHYHVFQLKCTDCKIPQYNRNGPSQFRNNKLARQVSPILHIVNWALVAFVSFLFWTLFFWNSVNVA